MKLDTNLFPVNVIEFEQKKVLVRTDQAEATKGKNMIVSNELRNRIIKPWSPEVGVWKENVRRAPARRIKPTSNMLIDKYLRQQEERRRHQGIRGAKRQRTADVRDRSYAPGSQSWHAQQRTAVYQTAARLTGMTRVTGHSPIGNGLCLDKLTERGSDTILLCGEESSRAHNRAQVAEHVMMVGDWPCRLSSKIHMNG
jgi:hypothetical protein